MLAVRVLVVATIVLACLAEEQNAEAPSELSSAVGAAKTDLWELITTKNFQWVIAIFGLVFGYVALTDGKKFFQWLVLVSVGAVSFCFVLSQLQATWVGNAAKIAKYFASLEVALFMGFAAKKGWDCTQLLLGLAVGMYIFHTVQGVALSVPQIADVATHSVWITALCTLTVLLGCWMTHENHGAGRVMGVLTPLFGSSVVVAAIGYLAMLAFTGDVNTPSKVPSVIEFWNMIVFPMQSQAVGIFHSTDTALTFGTHKFEIDQVLGVFFTIVIFGLSVKYQLKADTDERHALKAPLLAPEKSKPKESAEAVTAAKLP